MTTTFYSQQRINMVDGQIRIAGVTDERILDAFSTISREDFVPEERRAIAYSGEDLMMGEGRFMVEPSSYARLIQAANIKPDSHVLDIGCLTGYSTAILGSLSSYVCGVDSQEWIMKAKRVAESTGLAMQDFFIGTLVEGAPEKAPFDVIVINGAIQVVPQELVDQLKEDGVIVSFWRGPRNEGQAVLFRKHGGMLNQEILFDAFVPVLAGFEKEREFAL